MPNITESFLRNLKKYKISGHTQTLGVCLSAGVDSAVLLDICSKFCKKVKAIHVNHNLQNCALDFEKSAKALCQSRGISLDIKHVNWSDFKPASTSVEQQARQARLSLIEQWAQEQQIDVLLMGHNLDEHIESKLMFFIRGQGLKSLLGIETLSKCGKTPILRPLIGTSKESIYAYAKDNEIAFYEDPSNKDSSFTRNFLRNDVIPVLKRNPSCAGLFVDNRRLDEEIRELIELRKEVSQKDFELVYDEHTDSFLENFTGLSDLRAQNVLSLYLNFKCVQLNANQIKELLKKIKSKHSNCRFNINTEDIKGIPDVKNI